MPIRFLNVEARLEGGLKFPVLCGFLKVIGPVLVTEPNKPPRVLGGAAYFFGKTRIKISRTTWMMLFSRRGDSAMISLAASRAMATIAEVAGSIAPVWEHFRLPRLLCRNSSFA